MKRKEILFIMTGCLFLSVLFMFPYLGNELSLEHDTLFHLSRIEGLAESLKSGKLIPDIYPHKNDGFGYASALFYCDLFLLPAALLYNLGAGVALGYKMTIFLATLLSALSMAFLMIRLKKSAGTALIASALYLFCNYRITDVYVRGALGEVIAMAFIPFVLMGAYELLIEEKPKIKMLILGFTGLALSHNLTLLLGCIGFGALLLMNLDKMNKQRGLLLMKAAFICVGLSAWFLFPMLEQTAFQEYYLHYYASSSDLASHAMASWQYLINNTVFGVSGNAQSADTAMAVTPGLFLLGLPMLSLFHIHRKHDAAEQFIGHLTFLGYAFAFFCSFIFPWEQLFFLRILQFPWRLMTLACAFLSVCAASALYDVFQHQKFILLCTMGLILVNGVHLLLPAIERTLVIHNDTTYEELMNGSIIDPYFASTTYNRIEVAGADYLPIGFLDYKSASHCITDLSGNEISCDVQKDAAMSFSAPENTEIIIPLTAYKGYTILSDDEEIPWTTVQGRLSIHTGSHTEFTVIYQKTWLHKLSIFISSAMLVGLFLVQILNHRQNRMTKS